MWESGTEVRVLKIYLSRKILLPGSVYDFIPCKAILSDLILNTLMSAPQRQSPSLGYPLAQPMPMQPYIRVNDHDVLSGRGVNIAQHAGNERFRALIFSRHDVNYCHAYTTAEKRAIAEEIVGHIKSLNPPGRFLRRSGRSNRTVRGLDGPWEELSKDEAIKKTCQALRDCNRQDRTGYAASVSVPEDVSASKQARSVLGLTNKQLAELAAAQVKQRDESHDRKHAAISSPYATNVESRHLIPHQVEMRTTGRYNPYEPTPIGEATSTSANLLWLMKQNVSVTSSESRTPLPLSTPTTSGSSGDYDSIHDGSFNRGSIHNRIMHHHRAIDEYSPVTTDAMATLLSTQCEHGIHGNDGPTNAHRVSTSTETQDQEFDDCNDDFSTHFDEDDVINHMVHDIHKHSQDHNIDGSYHITAAEAAVGAAMEEAGSELHRSGIVKNHRGDDFGPPSPLHLDHHNEDGPF